MAHRCAEFLRTNWKYLATVDVDGNAWDKQDGLHNGNVYWANSEGDKFLWWSTVDAEWQIGPALDDPEAAGSVEQLCPLGDYTAIAPHTTDYEVTATPPSTGVCVSRCDEKMVLCGECGQVCSVLCVDGALHPPATSTDRYEFVWYDDTEVVDGETTGTRGWLYTDPITDQAHYLILEEDDDGTCRLRPFFEDGGDESYDPIDIDFTRGCSCRLFAVGNAGNNVEGCDSNLVYCTISVRCGHCSCWDFFCGTCRCVPKQLCIQVWINGDYIPRQILSWSDGEWGNTDPVYGDYGGYSADDISIRLDADAAHRCILVPYLGGERLTIHDVNGDEIDYPVYDCKNEMIGGQLDPSIDFIHGFFRHMTKDMHVWIRYSTHLADCAPSICTTGTSCNDECGGHPGSITFTFRAWNDPYLDEPYLTEDECTAEVTVSYIEEVFGDEQGAGINCWYEGFAVWTLTLLHYMGGRPTCEPFTVIGAFEYNLGVLTAQYTAIRHSDSLVINNQIFGWPFPMFYTWDMLGGESCDPYYTETGEISFSGQQMCEWPSGWTTDDCVAGTCAGCSPLILSRYEIIGTE